MHTHLTHYLTLNCTHTKFKQFVKQQPTPCSAPYAFHPRLKILGIGIKGKYTCPHEACRAQIRHLNQLSPHCGVVSELVKLHPEAGFSEFCAGYILVAEGKVTTNERSGHFGHNWCAEHRMAVREFFAQSIETSHEHI